MVDTIFNYICYLDLQDISIQNSKFGTCYIVNRAQHACVSLAHNSDQIYYYNYNSGQIYY